MAVSAKLSPKAAKRREIVVAWMNQLLRGQEQQGTAKAAAAAWLGTADQRRQFTVVGKDADGNTVSPLGTVTWGVTGGIGTINSSGLLSANTVGTGTVTATIGAVTDSTGSITVTAGALASLTVSTDTATLTADQTQQFTVTGRDADGNAVTSLGTITWSLTGSIGTINPSTGLFTANTVGTGTVRATSSLGGITHTSGTITVTAGALAGLTVSPDTATLTADQTQQSSAQTQTFCSIPYASRTDRI